MQERFTKYFWDGRNNLSPQFILRRLLEYASIPDLIHYPFSEVKMHFDEIPLEKLWTGEERKLYLKGIKPFIADSSSWAEAHMKMVEHFTKNFHFTVNDEQISEVK